MRKAPEMEKKAWERGGHGDSNGDTKPGDTDMAEDI